MNRGGRPRGPNDVRRLPEVEARRLRRTALELYERGLAYTSISIVLDLYEGVYVPPSSMRDWLDLPRNERKARQRYTRSAA